MLRGADPNGLRTTLIQQHVGGQVERGGRGARVKAPAQDTGAPERAGETSRPSSAAGSDVARTSLSVEM